MQLTNSCAKKYTHEKEVKRANAFSLQCASITSVHTYAMLAIEGIRWWYQKHGGSDNLRYYFSSCSLLVNKYSVLFAGAYRLQFIFHMALWLGTYDWLLGDRYGGVGRGGTAIDSEIPFFGVWR